jgi:hypothetical protein
MSDNGKLPAFPGEKNIRFGQPKDFHEGLTKREYMALETMKAILANPYWARQADTTDASGTPASAAIYHTDALLAALEPK